MSTDLNERIRTALDQHCARAGISDADIADVLRRANSERPDRRTSRFVPYLVAAAVVALVFGAVILPQLLPGSPRPAAAPAGAPSLPDPIAGLSLLTGSVAASPPGAAIAYYTAGPEADLGYEQPMTLSAYGDRYRRLTQADDRGCNGVDDGVPLLGGPAKALLSPDGRRVAIGDSCAAHGDVEMVDLSTGRSRSFPILKGRAVRAMAWSANGRYLAYVITPTEHEPLTGTYPNIVQTGKGILGLLDVTTGSTRQFSAYTQVRAVAFRPDGREIAVQDGATLRILAADGSQLRTLATARDHELSDANAWSPDGSMLVTGPLSEPPAGLNPTQTFVAVDPAGLGRPVPKAVSQASNPYSPILGWRSADSFLVRGPSGRDTRYPDDALAEVSLRTGKYRTLSILDGGAHGVGALQLASNLVPKMTIVPAADPDRGPWPGWALTVSVVLVLLACGCVVLVRRFARRRAR